MSPRRLRVSFAALALLVLGCQSGDSQPAAAPAPAPAPAAPSAPEAPPAPEAAPPAPADAPAVATTGGAGAVIALLDAGAEPRQPLRLQLNAGDTQTMVMTMRMAIAMEIGGQSAPKTSIPPMQITMNHVVKSIDAGGDIHTEFSLDKIEVLDEPGAPADLVAKLKTMLATVTNLSGASVVTPRGVVKSATFNMPPDINPEIQQTMDSMRQQLNQLAVPFPEEAIGAGAKWTVTQQLEQQNMKLQQVATWELAARHGEVIELTTKIVQTAPPQAIEAPGMPPGAKVRLERLDSTGSGTNELDLRRIAPVEGTMTMTSSIAMVTESPEGTMPLTMTMDLNLDIAGGK